MRPRRACGSVRRRGGGHQPGSPREESLLPRFFRRSKKWCKGILQAWDARVLVGERFSPAGRTQRQLAQFAFQCSTVPLSPQYSGNMIATALERFCSLRDSPAAGSKPLTVYLFGLHNRVSCGILFLSRVTVPRDRDRIYRNG